MNKRSSVFLFHLCSILIEHWMKNREPCQDSARFCCYVQGLTHATLSISVLWAGQSNAPRPWITFISQISFNIQGVVTAPSQFMAD